MGLSDHIIWSNSPIQAEKGLENEERSMQWNRESTHIFELRSFFRQNGTAGSHYWIQQSDSSGKRAKNLCNPMFLINVIINVDMLWWRAVVMRTFHHTHCVRSWSMCLDPVMKCCERSAITGGGVVLSIMMTMVINVFDECHHWWRHIVVMCCCCADISSHALCEIMEHVSGSGDEMSRTQCNNGGCCTIHSDDYGYQCFWWMSSLMSTCTCAHLCRE